MSAASALRALVARRLGPANLERLALARRCLGELRDSYRSAARAGRPATIDAGDVRSAIEDMGVQAGDVVHVHSSASHLMEGARSIALAGQVVRMLIELVGETGTVLMNTDALASGWDHALSRDVFDYVTWPSRRGLISEVFRRRRDVVRSVHPWYNVTAWGRRAVELVGEHHRSAPYAMDEHSPWFKLNQVEGKVLLLGNGFRHNSLVHLVEYLYPDEFPRPVFLNRPVTMRYTTRERQVAEMPVMLHAPLWKHGAEGRFAEYLQERYGFYQTRRLANGAELVCYRAADQFEAIRREMKQDVTWYDLRFGG